MDSIYEPGRSGRPHGRACLLLGCLMSAIVAAAPGVAVAAQPKRGAWESGGTAEPRVSFDVVGGAARRRVQRVVVPVTCPGNAEPNGWSFSDLVTRVRADGRFLADGPGFVLRGRFVTRERAEVTVRGDQSDCRDSRRYVVDRYPGRVPVRTGGYLSVTAAAAGADLQVSAFGRMVTVTYLNGAVPARCSDGSQRPLVFAGPEAVVLAAPIRPSGRFGMKEALGASISVEGSFAGGSVAALVDMSDVMADGVRCQARGIRLVGSLAFPEGSAGDGYVFPGPPLQRVPGDAVG